MSWVSEAAHSQSGATVLAGLVTLTVGLIASGVTLFIGWRQSAAAWNIHQIQFKLLGTRDGA